MKRALVVDDVEMNRDILGDILCDEYDVVEAVDGLKAVEILSKEADSISVVLLDIVMPGLDGFGVLQKMTEEKWIERIPVLIISGESTLDIERRCFEYDIYDFIGKPFNNHRVKMRVSNAVKMQEYKNHLEDEVKKQTLEIREKNKILAEMNDSIILMLGDVVEARNRESGQHVKRVKKLTKIIGKYIQKNYPEYALTDEDVKLIATASPMHDIGKIMISDNILLKPGKLTSEEFEEMKKHTLYGCEVLERVSELWPEEYNAVCRDICLCHHEKWDGKGYPNGLKGDEIPISAQIVSLADVFDALVTDRPYKKRFEPETAYNMILNGECGAYSDKIFDALKNCYEDIKSEEEHHEGSTAE